MKNFLRPPKASEFSHRILDHVLFPPPEMWAKISPVTEEGVSQRPQGGAIAALLLLVRNIRQSLSYLCQELKVQNELSKCDRGRFPFSIWHRGNSVPVYKEWHIAL
jgi:hypothetical protein